MKIKLVALFAIALTIGQVFAEGPQIPTPEVGFSKLREMCVKNSKDPEALENIQLATMEARDCLKTNADLTAVMETIQSAKFKNEPNSTVLLNMYCPKAPAVYQCMSSLINKFKYCLDDTLKPLASIAISLYLNFEHYACSEGKQLSEFIDEQGHTCIVKNALQIIQCINVSIMDYKFTGFGMTLRECDLILKIKNCIVMPMTQDECVRPSEILESFYKTAYENSLCPEQNRY